MIFAECSLACKAARTRRRKNLFIAVPDAASQFSVAIDMLKFAVKRFARAALIISAQANGLILSDLNGRLRRHLDG